MDIDICVRISPRQLLKFFRMRSNLLLESYGVAWTGSIPSEIGLLSNKLEVFVIEDATFGPRLSQETPASQYNLTETPTTTTPSPTLTPTTMVVGNFVALDVSPSTAATIPTELYQLTKLRILSLKNSNLTGRVTRTGLEKLSHLERFDISFNMFTGAVPQEVCFMPNLTYVNWESNRFPQDAPEDLPRLCHLFQP